MALADKPAVPFRVPAGIKLIRVDAKSGMRAGPGEGGSAILEAFKPGTAPPDNYSVIGIGDADGRCRLAGRRSQSAPSGPAGCTSIMRSAADRRIVGSAARIASVARRRRRYIRRSIIFRKRDQEPCAPKSNVSSKRSSSRSGC